MKPNKSLETTEREEVTRKSDPEYVGPGISLSGHRGQYYRWRQKGGTRLGSQGCVARRRDRRSREDTTRVETSGYNSKITTPGVPGHECVDTTAGVGPDDVLPSEVWGPGTIRTRIPKNRPSRSPFYMWEYMYLYVYIQICTCVNG